MDSNTYHSHFIINKSHFTTGIIAEGSDENE